MPVYDVGKKLEDGFFENAEILKEYYILKVIPAKPRERFFGGEINIGEIGDFGNRLFSGTLAIKESNAQGIVPGIYAEFAEKQKFFSMPLNIPSINMQIATAIGGMSEKKIDELETANKRILKKFKLANLNLEKVRTNGIVIRQIPIFPRRFLPVTFGECFIIELKKETK